MSTNRGRKSRSENVENRGREQAGWRLWLPDWLIVFAILGATFAVYAQTLDFDFVNYDDPEYVSGNPHVRAGLTTDSIAWAFTSTEAANWFPVTRLSHMLDCQLFDLRAGWHHLTNVLVHGLAAMLLFAFLRRATGARWPSAFVAFIFAVHPLHVESVAWIAERKDVLSAFFWFLALWGYVRYTERPSPARYALVIAAFCGGLMSKPMIVTLPLVLVLLDIWPLCRKPALKEKAPLFALAAVAAVFTFAVQQRSGAVRPLALVPPAMRIENALVSYLVYIGKTVWPSSLAVFYPYPLEIPIWQWAPAAIALTGATLLVLWRFRQFPFLAAGWFWFLITLAPVIGVVQVGSQARADRYLYVPMIGLLIMMGWGAQALIERQRRFKTAVAVGAVLACGACLPPAAAQTSHWENSETLFRHALAVAADNYLAEHNLGSALMEEPGKLAEAAAHLQRAVQLDPDSVRARTDLGSTLAKMGRLQNAIAEYRVALRLDPASAITHHNLGSALVDAGSAEAAIAEYEAALRLDPLYAAARSDLAEARYRWALDLAKTSGRSPEAIAEMELALRDRPDYPEAHNNLGVLLAQVPGRSSEALQHFEQAIRLRPDYVDARYNLAVALADHGRTADAVAQLEAALQIRDSAPIREALEKLRGRK